MAKQSMARAAANVGVSDDAVLVEQVRAGDMNAFSRLVTRYQDRVVNTCWRISGSLDEAQDLAQEAFLRALESIDSFRHQAGFYTWLFRIATNLSISYRRRSARAVKLSLHDPDGRWRGDHQAVRLVGRVSDEPDEPSARVSSRELAQMVVQSLEEMDDDYRVVVVLRDMEGMDYQQIAEILEVPIGTVKSRLHRARMELRAKLGPHVAARS